MGDGGGARDRGGTCCIKGRSCIEYIVEKGLCGTVSCGVAPVHVCCAGLLQQFRSGHSVPQPDQLHLHTADPRHTVPHVSGGIH